MKSIVCVIILLLILSLLTHTLSGYFPSRIIIVEDAKVCFHRALAGKRVNQSLVRRAISCGKVEDCQQECQDEKLFVCEGFNYRLDPLGRGNGDCELFDLPMSRLNINRDIYSNSNYDIYEKDRNAYPDCRSGGFGFGFKNRQKFYKNIHEFNTGRNSFVDRRYDSVFDGNRPEPFKDQLPSRRIGYPISRFEDTRRGGYIDYDYRRRYGGRGETGDYYNHKNYVINNYRESSSYHPERTTNDYNNWGLGDFNSWGVYGDGHTKGHGFDQTEDTPSVYNMPFEPTYSPKPNYDLLNHQNGYLSGGTLYSDNVNEGHSYANKYGGTYGQTKPSFGIVIPITSNNFGQPKHSIYGPANVITNANQSNGNENHDYSKIPFIEDDVSSTNAGTMFDKNSDSFKNGYNFLKEECSLRAATGFRLHKLIEKQKYSVRNIYECEMLCFQEKNFQCHSYAYRYTMTSAELMNNCYLSQRNFKELDFYTDLEPDRDFDIYVMSNRKKCYEQIPLEREYSDCFWRTRSGQRFENKIVRLATTVNSIVECQLACLRSIIFLCRGFSFRYGSPVLGKSVENCLLTDWPSKEIDSTMQLHSQLGFEIYERGSFGHGCERNHFAIYGKDNPIIGANTDQLCYVGYGTPARLLPSAIRESTVVSSELNCKKECSRFRDSNLFPCMSFSYRTMTQRGESNCDLSDILQRDLLDNVDYVRDINAWLFTWNDYNPECVSISNMQYLHETPSLGNYDNRKHERYGARYAYGTYLLAIEQGFSGKHKYDQSSHFITHQMHPSYYLRGAVTALETWRIYSVSGWPCRRGSICRQNKDVGFWYCNLDGGDRNTWDYCCRPDHQCGYSEGYNYSWCYVGSIRTQWRKCSEIYYPYLRSYRKISKLDKIGHEQVTYYPNSDSSPPNADRYLSLHAQSPTPFRAIKPLERPGIPPNMPSLNEYESEFNRQFLDPPKPNGFSEPRYWPVSYLHKELPPEAANNTEFKYDNVENRHLSTIRNLISIFKSNTLREIEYQINNGTKLLIQLALPKNLTVNLNSDSENKINSSIKTTIKNTMSINKVDIADVKPARIEINADDNSSGASEDDLLKNKSVMQS